MSEPQRPDQPVNPEPRPVVPALPVLPSLPHTWRPLGPRVVGIALAVCTAAAAVAAGVSIGPEVRSRYTPFQVGTLVVAVLGYSAVLYSLLRSRVTATREGLVVVNGYRRHDLEWAQVVEVRLMRGAPWATLDLADGESLSVLAIQGSDGDRARLAARELRALAIRANS